MASNWAGMVPDTSGPPGVCPGPRRVRVRRDARTTGRRPSRARPQRRSPSTDRCRARRAAPPAAVSGTCDQGTVVVSVDEVSVEAPPTTTERRLEMTTEITITRTAPNAISRRAVVLAPSPTDMLTIAGARSEEHTSELQSRQYLVCRLLLEKKKKAIDRVQQAGSVGD